MCLERPCDPGRCFDAGRLDLGDDYDDEVERLTEFPASLPWYGFPLAVLFACCSFALYYALFCLFM